jgi:RsiW-degrading membrane proteinase PrsW (M82 family)
MLIYLILFVIFSYYAGRWATKFYSDYKKYGREKTLTFKRFKQPIVFVAIVALPLLAVNLFFNDLTLDTPEKKIEYGESNDRPDQIAEGYRERILKNPYTVDDHYNYIYYAIKTSSLNASEITNWYQLIAGSNAETHYNETAALFAPGISEKNANRLNNIGHIGVALATSMSREAGTHVSKQLDKVSDRKHKYLYYAYGYNHFLSGEYALADSMFRKEIANDGYKKGAYNWLSIMYVARGNKKELAKLMYTDEAFPFIPRELRREYYFKEGNFLLYFLTRIEFELEHLNLFGVIAAFLVALIWLVYIRNLDIFEPEKWSNLILTFLLGFAFTYLVMPLTDALIYYFDFYLNGELSNDFIYCVVGIGAVEELAKLIPFIIILRFTKVVNEPYDYILYASAAALGFACNENLLYYEESNLHIIHSRALTSVISHMFDSSIIAYAIILAKYKYKDHALWIIPLGFVLAAVSHGFYDFWLINEKASQYSILTLLFFLFSLHLWATMKNNALNNSNFYTNTIQPKNEKINFQLIASLLAVLMFEYIAIGWTYGPEPANTNLQHGSLFTGFMIFYVSSAFSGFKLKKGEWNSFSFPFRLPKLNFGSLGLPGYGNSKRAKDYTGQRLRLFAPKSNQFIGSELPVTGTVIKEIEFDRYGTWYVFKLDQRVTYRYNVDHTIVIRQKKQEHQLDDDKIPIYFMMFPTPALLLKSDLKYEDLQYMDQAFSRPID